MVSLIPSLFVYDTELATVAIPDYEYLPVIEGAPMPVLSARNAGGFYYLHCRLIYYANCRDQPLGAAMRSTLPHHFGSPGSPVPVLRGIK